MTAKQPHEASVDHKLMPMDREREVMTLLKQVVELSPAEKEKRLRSVASELAEEVRGLLALDDGQPTEIGEGWQIDLGSVDDEATPMTLPQRIGPYRILGLLGRGGMGAVFDAEQDEPVKRRLALKVIASSHLHEHGLLRFQAERQALARLSHPHIAQLFDAGSTADGLPYFAMEWVDGRPINEYADGNRLGIDQRIALFIGVCDAVAHAHRNGVLHRDLKPRNILVGEGEARPRPKVIDFGIAKALDRPFVDESFSHSGMLGTPAYMSPEAVTVAAWR